MTEFKQEYLDAIRDAMNMVLIRTMRGGTQLFTTSDVHQILLSNGCVKVKEQEESKVTKENGNEIDSAQSG